MISQRFKKLKSQERQLRLALLPRKLNKDILDLNPRISLRALSYRILCHAEIEHYLEDRAAEIAIQADKAWEEKKRVSLSTFSLLAFSGREMEALPETLKPPPSKKQTDWSEFVKPDKRFSKCVSEYLYYVRNKNNGIKENNLISIFLPLGVGPEDFDEILVAELNDFGTKRGEAVHRSASVQLQKGVNPKDEFEQMSRILNAMADLDDILNKISLNTN